GAEASLAVIEQSLANSAILETVLLEEGQDGVFSVDPVGEGFRWGSVNRSFARMAELGADGIAGTTIAASPQGAGLVDRCRQAVAQRSPVQFDDKLERSDAKLELQTRLTPVYNAGGACVRIVGVCRDVTEQRTAERLLRKQNRRLQN